MMDSNGGRFFQTIIQRCTINVGWQFVIILIVLLSSFFEVTAANTPRRQLRRPNVVVVDGMKYVGQSRSSCRNINGGQGIEGTHFISKNGDNCFELCNSDKTCLGFESINTPSSPQCQLWIQPIESMLIHHQRGHTNRSCFRKVDDDRRRILVQSAEEFLQDTRTSLLRSPSSTTKCPEPVENGRYCPLSYRPVSCGVNGCQYSNRCVAALAGYDKSFNGMQPNEKDTECILVSNIINTRTADEEEKTVITASSASTTSNRADNDLNNQACPEPNPNGRCPQNYKPVVCGRVKQCPYSNRCFAALAGWNNPDREQCTETDPFAEQEEGQKSGQEQGGQSRNEQTTGVCPRSTNNDVCSLNYNPVTCTSNGGNNQSCDYFNLCFAKLAGYQRNSCEGTCPVPTVQTTTTTSRSSVFSQASTWFHNTDTVTRTTHNGDNDSCGIHNTYNPVVCRNTSLQAKGTTCMYSNMCDAQSTLSYNIKQDCQMYCPSGNVGQMIDRRGTEEEAQALMKRNRLPPPQSSSNSGETVQECLRRNDGNQTSRPVTCGLNKCYYDNLCFATKGAGFDEDQCIFV